jgi:protein-S-isoprenylcysteine O-methyltransferase Ste14
MYRHTLLLLSVNLVLLTTARVVVNENVKIKQEPVQQTKEEDKIDPGDVIRLLVDLFTLGVLIYENCGAHAHGGRCTDFVTAVVVVLVLIVIVFAVCSFLGITLKQDARSVRNRQAAADGLRGVGFLAALSVANDRIKTNELNRKCR